MPVTWQTAQICRWYVHVLERLPWEVIQRCHAEAGHHSTLALFGQQLLQHQFLVPQWLFHLKGNDWSKYLIVQLHIWKLRFLKSYWLGCMVLHSDGWKVSWKKGLRFWNIWHSSLQWCVPDAFLCVGHIFWQILMKITQISGFNTLLIYFKKLIFSISCIPTNMDIWSCSILLEYLWVNLPYIMSVEVSHPRWVSSQWK